MVEFLAWNLSNFPANKRPLMLTRIILLSRKTISISGLHCDRAYHPSGLHDMPWRRHTWQLSTRFQPLKWRTFPKEDFSLVALLVLFHGFGLCLHAILFDFPWMFRLHCGQNKRKCYVLTIREFYRSRLSTMCNNQNCNALFHIKLCCYNIW